MNDNTKKRIMLYYNLLARNEGNPYAGGIMQQMVEDLSVEETVILEKKLSDNDSSYNRMMAYYSAFSSIMLKEDAMPYNIDLKGKNTVSMMELVTSVVGYDFEQERRITINGNEFIFKKSFPIEEYCDELSEIGEDEKGNRWYVQLDDEGRLVIY